MDKGAVKKAADKMVSEMWGGKVRKYIPLPAWASLILPLMKPLRKYIILAFMQTRFYSWLLLHVVPYIRFSMYYTSMRGWKYRRGYALLEPGDMIVTMDKKKLTTILIPGEFSHAAFCRSKGGEYEVAEMTHENFTKSDFSDICFQADRVVIGTGPAEDWTPEYIEEMLAECDSLENAVYDTGFSLEERKRKAEDIFTLAIPELYCSELGYRIDKKKKLRASLADRAGLGRPYISPTGMYLAMVRYGRIKWDSKEETR